jgi:hypothetical protein
MKASSPSNHYNYHTHNQQRWSVEVNGEERRQCMHGVSILCASAAYLPQLSHQCAELPATVMRRI